MPLRTFLIAVLLAVGTCALCLAPGPAHAKGKKDDPAAQGFKAAYSSEKAKVRAKAVGDLRGLKDAQKYAIIVGTVLPKEERADVVAVAIDVLSSVKEEAVVVKMAQGLAKGKLDVRLGLIEALGAIQGPTAYDALITATKDKDPFMRGMAAYGLGRHRRIEALETLMGMLEDSKWQVQATALSAIPRLKGPEQLETKIYSLIEFMQGVSGRLRDDVGEALRQITGKNHGRDPDKWLRWYDRRGLPPEEAKPGDVEDKGPSAGYGNQATKPHFYGLEVTSERLVILLDMSLSMNEPLQVDVDRLRRETSRRAITGKNAPKNDKGEPQEFDIPWWRVKTNLDLARYQSINLIEKLRPEQNFELIVFSDEVDTWMGRLVPATPANKLKAQRKILELEPVNKTNTWGALSTAFDLYDNQQRSYDKGPDDIYMVTDGAPSIGDITDLAQIEAALMQLWKIKQIRVNVIGIGVNLRALRRIATKTGGKAKFFN